MPHFLIDLVHLGHLDVGLVVAAATAGGGGEAEQVGDGHGARREEQLGLVHRLVHVGGVLRVDVQAGVRDGEVGAVGGHGRQVLEQGEGEGVARDLHDDVAAALLVRAVQALSAEPAKRVTLRDGEKVGCQNVQLAAKSKSFNFPTEQE